MMKQTICGVLVCLLAAASLHAQDSTSVAPWKTDLVGKAAATQAGFQDWQGGGVNSLALSLGLDGKAARTAGRLEQKHEMRLTFGLVKQDTLDFRKAEDVIWLASTFAYRGNGFFGRFQPTFSASVRTQFAAGFNFDKDPIDGTRPAPVKVSAFLAPAAFQQSLGLTYEPAPWISQRLGFGAKETVVTVRRFRALYGVDPADAVRFEGGLEARTEVDRAVAENVRYKASLGLFASFNKPENPDMIWENLVSMKVNSWLNVNFEYVLLYDKDVSDRIQMKEVLSVGVSFLLI